jgi:hypothetical protein
MGISLALIISSAVHLTPPHLISPHLTSPHLTSPHLNTPNPTSPHFTSPHLTSPHLTPPQHTPALHRSFLNYSTQRTTALYDTTQPDPIYRPLITHTSPAVTGVTQRTADCPALHSPFSYLGGGTVSAFPLGILSMTKSETCTIASSVKLYASSTDMPVINLISPCKIIKRCQSIR